jgi:2-hydroxychromene-2-carboxylate isomerase
MLRDRVQRSLAPRTVVALSRIRLPRPWSRGVRVELYFAYDDPYAALGLPGLVALTRERGLELELFPLVDRGIPGDPAAQPRRLYSVVDADRLAQRDGRRLERREPLAAADCAFLAAWTDVARGDPALPTFASAAVTKLWFGSSGPVRREAYAELYRGILECAPPIGEAHWSEALARNAQRLRSRGHWESPAARIDGEWFFAHERLPQIAARLDQKLGRTR